MDYSFNISAIINPEILNEETTRKFKENQININKEFSQIFSDLLENKVDILILHSDYFNKFKIQYPKFAKRLNITVSTIVVNESGSSLKKSVKDMKELDIIDFIESPIDADRFDMVLYTAKNLTYLKTTTANNKRELTIYKDTIKTLNEIGLILSSEKNLDTLLNIILAKIRRLTNSDSGSIFIVDNKETLTKEERTKGKKLGYVENKNIVFKIAQNDSCSYPYTEHKMPITTQSLAGWVALHSTPLIIDDAYKLIENKTIDYKINTEFDKAAGYRSKSMLVLPMKNHKDEIVGIIQLINRKKNRHIILDSEEDIEKYVLSYDHELEDLALSVASQAAVAIENVQLIQNINEMVEGFVTASVIAIEQRDPTSGGHSERVANLAVALAEEINSIDTGRFRYINFSWEQIIELRYAALLHDFGKVGVREHILTKAKKLHKWEIEILRERFGFLKEHIKANAFQKKIDFMEKYNKNIWDKYVNKIDEEVNNKMNNLESYFNFLIDKNKPSYMNKEDINQINRISGITFSNMSGIMRPLLKKKEIINLSIPTGTLNEVERDSMKNHVIHSYNFLIKIPWLKYLKNVPVIAYGHHEKLDGSGYPRGIKDGEIPFQAKIMTVCDIFDALTANDRPYRFAISVEKAIHILELNAEEYLIDKDIVDVFRAKKVYRSVGLF